EIIETQSLLVAGEFDLDAFLSVAVDRVLSLTSATGAAIELVDGHFMVYQAAAGSIAPFVGLRLKRASSLSGYCVQTRQIAISDDTSKDSRVDQEACRRVGAMSMIVVPLLRTGEVVGVLKIVSPKLRAFSESDRQILELMAGLVGGALGQQLEIKSRQAL